MDPTVEVLKPLISSMGVDKSTCLISSLGFKTFFEIELYQLHILGDGMR